MLSELRSQHGSQGIVYEPYRRPHFKLCVHEEPDVGGRNERYEFRCDADLYCCGRVCCLTDETLVLLGIPLWIWLTFLTLGLLVALATLLWFLCNERPTKAEWSYYSVPSPVAHIAPAASAAPPPPPPATTCVVEQPRSVFVPSPAEQMMMLDTGSRPPSRRAPRPELSLSRQSLVTLERVASPTPMWATRGYILPSHRQVPAYNPI